MKIEISDYLNIPFRIFKGYILKLYLSFKFVCWEFFLLFFIYKWLIFHHRKHFLYSTSAVNNIVIPIRDTWSLSWDSHAVHDEWSEFTCSEVWFPWHHKTPSVPNDHQNTNVRNEQTGSHVKSSVYSLQIVNTISFRLDWIILLHLFLLGRKGFDYLNTCEYFIKMHSCFCLDILVLFYQHFGLPIVDGCYYHIQRHQS